jgi:hypothetical protein
MAGDYFPDPTRGEQEQHSAPVSNWATVDTENPKSLIKRALELLRSYRGDTHALKGTKQHLEQALSFLVDHYSATGSPGGGMNVLHANFENFLGSEHGTELFIKALNNEALMRNTLARTQAECTRLVEETRALKKQLRDVKPVVPVDAVRKFVAENTTEDGELDLDGCDADIRELVAEHIR